MESMILKVKGPQGERAPKVRQRAPLWARRLEDAGALRGFRVVAVDGQAGKIEQVLYWSDTSRPDYIVVQNGRWLFGHKAVIPVETIEDVDVSHRRLRVALSKEQIRRAPEYLPWT